jgi:hypothetical protein
MAENTPYTDLKEAIRVLEKKQAESRQLLQEQFKVTYEKLNPFNFLKNTFNTISESPEVRNNILTFILPLATGILTKRAFAGTRTANIAKQAGILLLDGLNRYVHQNPEIINTVSQFILGIFRKKKQKVEQVD